MLGLSTAEAHWNTGTNNYWYLVQYSSSTTVVQAVSYAVRFLSFTF